MIRSASVVAALAVALVAAAFAVADRSGDVLSFRIASLRATVVDIGELSSWDFHDRAYGVRLRATVCFGPDARTVETYPVEFAIAHHVVRGPAPGAWGRPFRTVSDEAHWIVPFGETIEKCGPVVVEDILPDEDYKGLESELGVLSAPAPYNDPDLCYGVELRIRAAFESKPRVVREACGRAVVRCGSFGPNEP